MAPELSPRPFNDPQAESFHELLTRLDPVIRRACRQGLGRRATPDNVEEAVGDAIVHLCRWRTLLEEVHNPYGWAYAVAKNRAIDLRRRLDRAPLWEPIHLHAWTLQANSPEPDAAASSAAMRAVWDTVSRLDQANPQGQHRTLLHLRFEQQLSIAAISDALGISRATVNRRLRTLRKAIEAIRLDHPDAPSTSPSLASAATERRERDVPRKERHNARPLDGCVSDHGPLDAA